MSELITIELDFPTFHDFGHLRSLPIFKIASILVPFARGPMRACVAPVFNGCSQMDLVSNIVYSNRQTAISSLFNGAASPKESCH